MFGPENNRLAFEEAKRDDKCIADIALATVLDSPSVPESRADEIGSLLQQLLGPADQRSLEPLVGYLGEYAAQTCGTPDAQGTNLIFASSTPPDFSTLSLQSPAGGAELEDGPVRFPMLFLGTPPNTARCSPITTNCAHFPSMSTTRF